jgi:hypothetical protein
MLKVKNETGYMRTPAKYGEDQRMMKKPIYFE